LLPAEGSDVETFLHLAEEHISEAGMSSHVAAALEPVFKVAVRRVVLTGKTQEGKEFLYGLHTTATTRLKQRPHEITLADQYC
jgi:hypothetical protein